MLLPIRSLASLHTRCAACAARLYCCQCARFEAICRVFDERHTTRPYWAESERARMRLGLHGLSGASIDG